MATKTAVVMIALSLSALLAAAAVVEDSVEDTYVRNLTGTVIDNGGEPLRGAVVQLKNLTSLQVWSYITQSDGKYHFSGLHSETDYELRVLYRGNFSSAKRVGRLTSRKKTNVELRIHVPNS